MDVEKIKALQKQKQSELLSRSGVVSVGYGYKIVDGKITDEICLIIGVKQKQPLGVISKKDIIPPSIDGIKTDVVEIGTIYAQGRKSKKASVEVASIQAVDPKHKFRPAMPGCSIGVYSITAGTFSCVVKKNGERMILSNNHILADCNQSRIGADIYQPGPSDHGSFLSKMATLHQFVPLLFPGDESGNSDNPPKPSICPIAKKTASAANFVAKSLGRQHRLLAYNPQANVNYMDAAIAKPTTDDLIVDEIVHIGKPAGTIEATLGMEVQKYGRTTQYTTGKIIQLNATMDVNYGPGKLARFEEQIVATNMSAGGDSGSCVLDMNKNIVGLLFAGSSTSTILSPINKVFEFLGLSL